MKKKTIAILGPKLSHTDLAYKRAKRIYFPTISAVFLAVINGKAEYGLVPFKNTASGIIRETVMNIKKYKEKIKIYKRFWMKISHVLASLSTTTLGDIQTILTHPVIVDQCQKFLIKHFPDAKMRYAKTSSVACIALAQSKQKHTAVIASSKAVKYYGLKILKRHVEDNRKNKTQFVLLKLF